MNKYLSVRGLFLVAVFLVAARGVGWADPPGSSGAYLFGPNGEVIPITKPEVRANICVITVNDQDQVTDAWVEGTPGLQCKPGETLDTVPLASPGLDPWRETIQRHTEENGP